MLIVIYADIKYNRYRSEALKLLKTATFFVFAALNYYKDALGKISKKTRKYGKVQK